MISKTRPFPLHPYQSPRRKVFCCVCLCAPDGKPPRQRRCLGEPFRFRLDRLATLCLMRNSCQSAHQSGCPLLHSHRPWGAGAFSCRASARIHCCQLLSLVIAVLIGMESCPIAGFVCISLMKNDLEYLFTCMFAVSFVEKCID